MANPNALVIREATPALIIPPVIVPITGINFNNPPASLI